MEIFFSAKLFRYTFLKVVQHPVYGEKGYERRPASLQVYCRVCAGRILTMGGLAFGEVTTKSVVYNLFDSLVFGVTLYFRDAAAAKSAELYQTRA